MHTQYLLNPTSTGTSLGDKYFRQTFDSPITMTFSPLPIELPDLIVKEVENPKDLASLRLACRFMDGLADKRLWQKCTVKVSEVEALSSLCDILAEDEFFSRKIKRLELRVDCRVYRFDSELLDLVTELTYLNTDTTFHVHNGKDAPKCFESLQVLHWYCNPGHLFSVIYWYLDELPNLNTLAVGTLVCCDEANLPVSMPHRNGARAQHLPSI